MIGIGLKKLAGEHGMTISGGVAYGTLKGFATTLSEGAGYKRIGIATCFTDPQQQTLFQNAISQVALEKTYRVQHLTFAPKSIDIIFLDNPGTMKRILAFIDWFYPLLVQYGATGAGVCAECGGVHTGEWYLIDGIAFPLHSGCAEHIKAALAADQQKHKEEDTGSYVQGLLGSLLGAALGAVAWAVVLYIGFVASLVGLLIGWLADKGYTLCHGKNGKGKIVILIIAIIFGVVLGTIIPDIISLVQMIDAGELLGYTYADIPNLIVYLLSVDEEYSRSVGASVAMGLLFAGLGVYALLKKTAKEVTSSTVKKLN